MQHKKLIYTHFVRKVMRSVLFLISIFFTACVNATVTFESSWGGDYYQYIPTNKPKNIMVIAHGMLSNTENASDVAKQYITRWIPYADEYGLLLIAPVFDTARFGNLGGGYGGYRNLFGKNISADQFVNNIVDRSSNYTSSRSNSFYLYGHSAGGQFVNRYIVTHPDRIIRAVISAAGRYSYPTKSSKWPYGAGDLSKTIAWKDGTQQSVYVSKLLKNYAVASKKVSIVIGSTDIKPQPKRPAHVGNNRIEFAHSWARAMNENAKKFGIKGNVNVDIIPNVGHSSSKLTPYSAQALFGHR